MKNEYRVTWKLWKSWAAESLKKGPRLTLAVIWALLAAAFVILAFFDGNVLFSLLMAAFCVYRAVFRQFLAAKQQYAQMAKIYGCENWLRTITISESGILISEGTATLRYALADVVRIREKGDNVALDMRGKTVVRLYKSAFTEGSWEACRALLERK